MKRWLPLTLGLSGLIVACNNDSTKPNDVQSSNQQDFQTQHPNTHVMPPVGQSLPQSGAPRAERSEASALTDNGIQYHGGPIIYTQKVAAIYWGTSTIYSGGPTPGTAGTGAQDGSLVGFFLRNLGGSPYFRINTTYYDGSNTHVQNSVTYTYYWAVNSDPGTTVSDAQVQAQIIAAFTGGTFTFDNSTLYAVFSGSGVNLGGGFGSYCAYHGHFSWNGNDVKYAVMPYAASPSVGCNLLSGSPNNDIPADEEVNVLAHEIEETTTDPDINAWWDNSTGMENADKCAWTFGPTYTTANNSQANMRIGGKDFLVQRNWVNAGGGYCAMNLPPVAWTSGPYTMNLYQSGQFTSSGDGGVPPYTYQFRRQDCPVSDFSCGAWGEWISNGSSPTWSTIVYSCGIQHIYVESRVTDWRGNISPASGPWKTYINNPC